MFATLFLTLMPGPVARHTFLSVLAVRVLFDVITLGVRFAAAPINAWHFAAAEKASAESNDDDDDHRDSSEELCARGTQSHAR